MEHAPGFFGPGNPALGQMSTRVPYEWLNMVQEEMENILHAANIPIDTTKRNNAQIANAIAAMILAAVSGIPGPSVPGIPVVSVTILASALAANASFTVPEYTVGSDNLVVFLNGLQCARGSSASAQYAHAGAPGSRSTAIAFHNALSAGWQIAALVLP